MNWINKKIKRAETERDNYFEMASCSGSLSYEKIRALKQEGVRPAWHIQEDLARNKQTEIDLLEELQDQERG